MDISTIIPHLEALIFASDKPLTSLELTELVNNAFGFMEDKINLDQVESAIEGIIEKYSADFYPFEMKESGGGWQFLTKKEYHKTVAQLNGEKFLKRLSAASLETLAIVAYKQPITKGDVESIRGVNSDYSIQKLLEKELIVITGRNEDLPGKPLVYATSKSFMDYFGINSPEELPKIREVFADQAVEPTVINSDEELQFPADDVSAEEEDVSLVVRGNGELTEEPAIVVNEDTESIPAEDLEHILNQPDNEISGESFDLPDTSAQIDSDEIDNPNASEVEDNIDSNNANNFDSVDLKEDNEKLSETGDDEIQDQDVSDADLDEADEDGFDEDGIDDDDSGEEETGNNPDTKN